MRRISGKYAVGCLLLLALFGSLLNVSAQESNTGKGKGKAPAAGAGEKKGSGKAGKEPLTGTWKGTYTREGNTNEITLDLVQKGNTVTGSLIFTLIDVDGRDAVPRPPRHRPGQKRRNRASTSH